MRITIDGGHNILSCVNIPLCDVKYTRFGEGFFDSEALESSDTLEDIVRERFESFSVHENGWKEFSEWKKKNEDKAWYDLREGENGGLYIVAGDSESIKFISVVDFLALDYKGYEINVYSWGNDSYSFGFWIDPEGGILRASDDERSYFFYDDLENDAADYPRKDFNFKAALDDLVAHSDDYQNSNEDEDEEEEEEE